MTFFEQVPGTTAGQGSNNPQDIFLVDVRTAEEFAEGSVPGAVNIPLDILPTRLAEFQNKGQVLVFCRSGARSGMAKSFLEGKGIPNVINGGSWQHVNQFFKQ